MKRIMTLKGLVITLIIFTVVTGAFMAPVIINYESRIDELEQQIDANQPSENVPTDQEKYELERKELEKLQAIYDILSQNYVNELDKTELVDGAIKGMIESIEDPHTNYMSKEVAESFNEQMQGEYEGIGAGLYEDNGGVFIEYTFQDSPAEKAGVIPGDRIVEVDGIDVREFTSAEIVQIVRGDKGTNVTIGFERPNVQEIVYITITRDKIPLHTISHKLYEENGKRIGYIEMTRVGQKTYEEMLEALNELGEIDSLIVDVRNNPGGYLHIIQQIVDYFVGDEKPFIQLENRDGSVDKYYVSKNKYNKEVIVLINEMSASASEIFAAALNEIEGFELVGKKTFGKGTVQTQTPFEDGSSIKYTIQKFLTPSGEWIHGNGVSPTIEVEQPEFYSFFRVNLQQEIKDNIYDLQVLNSEKMFEVLGYSINVDGYLDEGTKEVIGTFQADNGLRITKTLNTEVANKLNNIFREKVKDEETDNQLQKALEILSNK